MSAQVVEYIGDLPVVNALQPAKITVTAPAEAHSRALEQLSVQIAKNVENERRNALLRGVMYILVCNLFDSYLHLFERDLARLEREGYDTYGIEPVANSIDEYRAQMGFTWDNHSNFYDLKKVAEHYIADYAMATIKIAGKVIPNDRLKTYAYEGGKVTISKIDPLLKTMPAYRLRDLVPFLSNKETAVKVMQQAATIQSMKRFEEWITEFKGMSAEEVSQIIAGNRTESIVGEPTKFKHVVTLVLNEYEARNPNWNSLLGSVKLPDKCPRGFAVIVKVKFQEADNRRMEIETDEEE